MHPHPPWLGTEVMGCDDCGPCDRLTGPRDACRGCRRGDAQAALPMVAGLTGR